VNPIPTFDLLLARMRATCPSATIRLRANTLGGQDDRHNVPAEVAVFTSPDLPGGCMVWGRTDQGWHANHGERAAISILLAKVKEQV